jgi:hypothetical protein
MTTANEELIHVINTWLHFIGGYYNNTERFISEAEKYGITRRAPAQTVRGMQFGDRLIFLRYGARGKATFAFAEARITGVTLQGEIAKQVTAELVAEGKAEFQGGGGGGGTLVNRECGSYLVVGSWTVKCDLSEVVKRAIAKAEATGEILFIMVNAQLTQAYAQPVSLSPAPKFTRGFIKAKDDASYLPSVDYQKHGDVVAVMNYSKAKKTPRLFPATLPLLT